jgi:hypothetical protein
MTWSLHLNISNLFFLYLLNTIKTSIRFNHKWPSSGEQQMLREILELTPWHESVSELYRPSDRRLSAKLVQTFADSGCHVVSAMNPYSCNLDFLDWSSYCFFRAAPQLYSWGWVHPVPDPLLLRKSGSTRNRTRTSGSVARNSDR